MRSNHSVGMWARRIPVLCVAGLVVNAATAYLLAMLVPVAQQYRQARMDPGAAWRGALPKMLPEPLGALESRNAAITHWQVSYDAGPPVQARGHLQRMSATSSASVFRSAVSKDGASTSPRISWPTQGRGSAGGLLSSGVPRG